MKVNARMQTPHEKPITPGSCVGRRRTRALPVLLTALAMAASALAGTATYTFPWYQNAAVSDFPVPIALEEGLSGFTYAGFADAAHGSDLRAFGSDNSPLQLEIET